MPLVLSASRSALSAGRKPDNEEHGSLGNLMKTSEFTLFIGWTEHVLHSPVPQERLNKITCATDVQLYGCSSENPGVLPHGLEMPRAALGLHPMSSLATGPPALGFSPTFLWKAVMDKALQGWRQPT